MKKFKWTWIVLPILLLTACTSSKITSSWKDPSTTKALASYKNILVVGMEGNRQVKEQMENYLTEDLKKSGVNATASFDAFGPKAFANLNEDQIADKVRSKGYDGVITIALMDRKKEQNYVPGTVNYAPVGLFYNRFGRYYSTIYSRIYDPGYYTTSTNYFWETNLYDARQDKIIYSAQSQSFDPSSLTSMSKEHGKLIVKDLEKSGFLAAK
jgi:hypothetical protein